MANVYLQDSTLTAIGDAIRTKGGTTAQLYPSEMPAAITNLPSGGGAPEIDFYNLNVSKNSNFTYYMWKDWSNIITDFSKIIQFTILFGKGSIMATVNSENKYTTSGNITNFDNVTCWAIDGGFLTLFNNMRVEFKKNYGVGIYMANGTGSQLAPAGSVGAVSLALAKG